MFSKSVAYLHPDGENVGDIFSDIGTRYLMHKAIGPHYSYSIPTSTRGYPVWMDFPPADILVVSGSPWFWPLCEATRKYEMLKMAARGPFRKKVAMGIGASYCSMPSPLDELESRRMWSDFDAIT